MEDGPDTVYYDTGDVLVTSRRAAFQSVSVPLAGVSSARVERQTRMRPVHRRTLSAWDALLAVVWIIFLVVLLSLTLPLLIAAAAAPPGLYLRLFVAFLAVMLLSTVLMPGRQHVLVSSPVWAVLLKTDRKEIELYRTRHRRKAVRVVEAINRAVAAARG